jgi:hypothetical protein
MTIELTRKTVDDVYLSAQRMQEPLGKYAADMNKAFEIFSEACSKIKLCRDRDHL